MEDSKSMGGLGDIPTIPNPIKERTIWAKDEEKEQLVRDGKKGNPLISCIF